MDLGTIVMIIFLIVGFALNKTKLNANILKLLKGILLIAPFFAFCFLSITWQITPKISLYLLQISIFTACAGLRLFNKSGTTYQASKIGIIVTTIFYSSTLFGAFIIGNIPDQYGGEKKSLITYHIVPEEVQKIKRTALNGDITLSNTIVSQVLYQGTDFYYIKTKLNKIVALPKTFIESEEINIPKGYPKDHYEISANN